MDNVSVVLEPVQNMDAGYSFSKDPADNAFHLMVSANYTN